jgi:hypothetical protein
MTMFSNRCDARGGGNLGRKCRGTSDFALLIGFVEKDGVLFR